MHTQLAGLSVEVFQATTAAPSAAVILCHGYGAPGNDLVGLGQELVRRAPALRDVRFYFPAALLSLGANGWGEARAWWPLDLEQLQRLQLGDAQAVAEFRRIEPQGLPAARKALLALVNEVLNGTGLPARQLALGGFSQGSMLATDVALRMEEAPGALCILSGTLLIEDQWKPRITARNALPVFQSHGRFDPLLSFGAAQALSRLFSDAGNPHEFVAFDGAHGIDDSTMTGLASFLTARLVP